MPEEQYDPDNGVLVLERSSIEALVAAWAESSVAENLVAIGVIDPAGNVDPDLRDVAHTLAEPDRGYYVEVRGPNRDSEAWAWASQDTMVLAIPLEDDLLSFRAVAADDLPGALAKLIDLGPREPASVARRTVPIQVFEELFADGDSWPELAAYADPHAWSIAAVDGDGEERLALVVIDLGDLGYWKVDALDGDVVEVVSVTSTEVWAELTFFARDLYAD
jgi:hypothetical protein